MQVKLFHVKQPGGWRSSSVSTLSVTISHCQTRRLVMDQSAHLDKCQELLWVTSCVRRAFHKMIASGSLPQGRRKFLEKHSAVDSHGYASGPVEGKMIAAIGRSLA